MSATKLRCLDAIADDIDISQVQIDISDLKNGSNAEKTAKRSRAQLTAEDDEVDDWDVIDGTRYLNLLL